MQEKNKEMSKIFTGKKVLVTGGAGFIGSNLTHRLVDLGAGVTIIDNFHPDYGGNEYNLRDLKSKIKLVKGDICDFALLEKEAVDAELIYHIAAQCSHVDSMTNPLLDIDYNCKGTISVLEAAKKSEKKPPVIYASSRAVIGSALEMPAVESTLPNPVDIYGVNKYAAELYGAVYARTYKIPYISMRLTNSFGAYHQMKSGKYGILNWFISQAMQGKTLKIYGTGSQLRDYLYVDDAIDAFICAGLYAKNMGADPLAKNPAQIFGSNIKYAVFNIASGKPMKFSDCAIKVAELCGGKVELVPWPEDRKAIETGDYSADCAAAHKILGWKDKVSFVDGLVATIDYYKSHLKHYL